MENYKRAFNFLIAMLIASFLAILVPVIGVFIANNNPSIVLVIAILVGVLAIAANIFIFLACYEGKKGGSSAFGIAFWVNLALLVLNITSLILSVCNVTIEGLNIAITVLTTISGIGTYLFIILGCQQAVPSLKTFSIVTLVFYLLGYALPKLSGLFKSDTLILLFGVLGVICALVGFILFIILVIQGRARVAKEN